MAELQSHFKMRYVYIIHDVCTNGSITMAYTCTWVVLMVVLQMVYTCTWVVLMVVLQWYIHVHELY